MENITWYHFVIVILPLFVSLIVAAYTLIQSVKTSLYAEIRENRKLINTLANNVSTLKIDISVIKSQISKGNQSDG